MRDFILNKWTWFVFVGLLVALFVFGGLAQAQEVSVLPEVAASEDIGSLAIDAMQGVLDRDLTWSARIGLILVLAVALLRKYATKLPGAVGAFFGTSEGGSVLLFILTFLGGLGTAMAAGAPFDMGLAKATVLLGITTAGGWHVVAKPLWAKVLQPLFAKLWAKLFGKVPAVDEEPTT